MIDARSRAWRTGSVSSGPAVDRALFDGAIGQMKRPVLVYGVLARMGGSSRIARGSLKIEYFNLFNKLRGFLSETLSDRF